MKKYRRFTSNKPKHSEGGSKVFCNKGAVPLPDSRKAIFRTTARIWRTENYSVLPEWREEILEWVGVTPDVDAFATKGNRQFKRYWCESTNAFDQDWSRDILWINAPWSKMRDVLLKAVMDQARGFMVILVWKGHSLFWELGKIALDWWDLPADVSIYKEDSALYVPPPKGWTTRVVLFDAQGSKAESATDEEIGDSYEANGEEHLRVRDLMSVDPQSP